MGASQLCKYIFCGVVEQVSRLSYRLPLLQAYPEGGQLPLAPRDFGGMPIPQENNISALIGMH